MTISHWIFAACAIGGLMLTIWAALIIGLHGISLEVTRIKKRLTDGPYRFFKHPMYLGETIMIAGMAGLAAGWWNFWAALFIMNLLTKEWAWREEYGA